jgi:hypothetical protein
MRLAQKFVTVNEIVTRERVRGGPVECRGTNIIGGEKHNCQDNLNYLQCGKPHVRDACVFLLTAGGMVSCRNSGSGEFFAGPDRRHKVVTS